MCSIDRNHDSRNIIITMVVGSEEVDGEMKHKGSTRTQKRCADVVGGGGGRASTRGTLRRRGPTSSAPALQSYTIVVDAKPHGRQSRWCSS
jgi:hypothetical protein